MVIGSMPFLTRYVTPNQRHLCDQCWHRLPSPSHLINKARAETAPWLRVALLILVLQSVGAAWVVEQPISSLAWWHPRLRALLRSIDRVLGYENITLSILVSIPQNGFPLSMVAGNLGVFHRYHITFVHTDQASKPKQTQSPKMMKLWCQAVFISVHLVLVYMLLKRVWFFGCHSAVGVYILGYAYVNFWFPADLCVSLVDGALPRQNAEAAHLLVKYPQDWSPWQRCSHQASARGDSQNGCEIGYNQSEQKRWQILQWYFSTPWYRVWFSVVPTPISFLKWFV